MKRTIRAAHDIDERAPKYNKGTHVVDAGIPASGRTMGWILGRDRKLLREKIVLQMTEHVWGRAKMGIRCSKK